MGTTIPDRERYWAERRELARYHRHVLGRTRRRPTAKGEETPPTWQERVKGFLRRESKEMAKLVWRQMRAIFSEFHRALLAVFGLR